MDRQNLLDLLSLQRIPKVGPMGAKNLIAYCGSAGEVFKQNKAYLQKIPGIGAKTAENIVSFKEFDKAEKEVLFMEKNGIKPLFYLEKDYPQRLKDQPDSPILLFYKGNGDLNHSRMLGVVGTRKATEYGRAVVDRLMEELAPYKVSIVSGLAYGIDVAAHKAAMKEGLETIGVVGHGLDMMYPASHRSVADKMMEQGGVLSEYFSGTRPDKEHFPARNRIVAGMIDGLVLVETAIKGGALITASIANSYDREVFAFPGRAGDEFSAGCNYFIKLNKAYLVESAADIAYWLGWNLEEPQQDRSRKYEGLDASQTAMINLLKEKGKLDIDNLCIALDMPPSDVAIMLLELEFKGIVQALPGKIYRLI